MPVAPRPILVTDGEQRSALAVVRSLGRSGRDVYVASHEKRPLAGASRHAAGTWRVPDPLADPAGYLAAIDDLVTRLAPGLILPITEAALRALLPERSRWPGVTIPWPAADRFAAISDKATVLRAAEELGIAIPKQWEVTTSTDSLPALGPGEFPVVVKPHASVGGGSGIKFGVAHAGNLDALRRAVQDLPGAAYPLLVQERIVGDGLGVFLLRWAGRTVAAFAHRRIREKPPSGGVSVCAESVPLDPALRRQAERLLDHFDWNGVAMVEFKEDRATGTPVLMEVNGRFWGSLQLAVDAGVDFPSLLVACACNSPPSEPPPWRIGVRNRWWWGDLDHLVARFRHSRKALHLPSGVPSRGRAALDFLAGTLSSAHNEVLRVDDPMPAVRESVQWFRQLIRLE